MEKLTDPDRLSELIHANAREVQKPSLEQISDWLSNASNLALVDGNDLSLFEWKSDGIHGHIFFASRGREALIKAKAMLDHVFSLGAKVILGETPKLFRDALWFSRRLGFEHYGEKETPDGTVILSRLTYTPKGHE